MSAAFSIEAVNVRGKQHIGQDRQGQTGVRWTRNAFWQIEFRDVGPTLSEVLF